MRIQEVVSEYRTLRECQAPLQDLAVPSSALGFGESHVALGTEAGSLEPESGGDTEAKLHLLHY